MSLYTIVVMFVLTDRVAGIWRAAPYLLPYEVIRNYSADNVFAAIYKMQTCDIGVATLVQALT